MKPRDQLCGACQQWGFSPELRESTVGLICTLCDRTWDEIEAAHGVVLMWESELDRLPSLKHQVAAWWDFALTRGEGRQGVNSLIHAISTARNLATDVRMFPLAEEMRFLIGIVCERLGMVLSERDEAP